MGAPYRSALPCRAVVTNGPCLSAFPAGMYSAGCATTSGQPLASAGPPAGAAARPCRPPGEGGHCSRALPLETSHLRSDGEGPRSRRPKPVPGQGSRPTWQRARPSQDGHRPLNHRDRRSRGKDRAAARSPTEAAGTAKAAGHWPDGGPAGVHCPHQDRLGASPPQRGQAGSQAQREVSTGLLCRACEGGRRRGVPQPRCARFSVFS